MALFSWMKTRKPQFDAPLAPDEAVFVLGDIHGRIDLFAQLVDQLEARAHPDAKLVCVGDYIDRGDESAEVLRQVMRMQAEASGQMTCLLGNHEKMLLSFLDAPERAGPRWMRYGGLQTMASFRVDLGPGPERDWPAIRDALRAAIGPEMEAWLRGLPLSWRSGNLFVAHAGADPERAIVDQPEHGLLWGGENFYDTPRRDGIWVAHGHVISDSAAPTRGRIPVDTGAYATGRLTAALVEPGATAERVALFQT
jgi:serine/threonine protein phosphatase 1